MALTDAEKNIALQLKSEGKTTQEIMSYIASQRYNRNSSVSEEYLKEYQDKEQTQLQEAGFLSRAGETIQRRGETTQQIISGEGEFAGETPVRRGFEAAAQVAGAVPEVAIQATPQPVRKAIEKVGDIVSSGFNKLTNLISDIPALQQWTQEHPEAAKAVEEIAGTTTAAGEIAGSILVAEGGVRGIQKTGQVAKKGIQQGFNKLSEASVELGNIKTPGIEGINIAKQAGLAPEDIMQRVARISKGKQTKFQELSGGESVGEYLVNRNIFGTPDQIVDQLYKRFKDSMSRVDDSIDTVKGEFKAPQVQTALDDLIKRDVKVSTKGALSPDSARIEQLYKKYNQQGLTLSEVNEVKRLYERNVRVDYLTIGAQADKLARATNIDSALRKLVEDKATKAGVTTVRELNKETQLAKQLMDDLGAEFAGQAGNNAIGLTDAIFLAEAVGSTNPVAAAGFIAQKGLKSKTIMSKIAEKLSKDAGSKAELPSVPEADKLTGYLEFLNRQGGQ